ncbi:hypothetical protein EGN69_17465 [Pseudomonas monteilii]|nr:hypothetical protein EGN69_17465 [Pseudomonas monteilii]
MNAKGKYTKENPRAKSVIFRHPNAVDKEDSSGYQCADGVLGCVDAVRDDPGCRLGLCHLGRHARALGDASGGGDVVGAFPGTLVVAAGVGSLLAGHPLALTLLTWRGAPICCGWAATCCSARHCRRPGRVGGESGSRWALKGFCVSGLNPKVFLLFLALLPQFTDPQSSWPVPLQILLLGLVHLCSSLVIYTLVGYGAELCSAPGQERQSWSGGCRGWR